MALQHYSRSQLTAIGEQASNRLPPASAMQGMFWYEMQREAENERLFQNQVFQLARAEERISDQDTFVADLCNKLKALGAQVEAIQSQLIRRDVQERLATSQVRLNAFQSKLRQYDQQFDEQSGRLATLEKNINSATSGNEISQKAIMAPEDEVISEDITNELSELNQDITVLFEERDAVAKLIDDVKTRTNGLEKETRQAVERIETANKKAEEGIKKVESAVNERVTKAEQQAINLRAEFQKCAENEVALYGRWAEERFVKIEQQQTSDRASIQVLQAKQISDRASLNQLQANELSKLEQKLAEHGLRVDTRIGEIEKRVADAANKAEKQAKERIATSEQRTIERLNKASQEATEQIAKASQDTLDRVAASQKLINDWLFDRVKEGKAEAAVAGTQAAEQIDKIGEQTSKLLSEFRSVTREQNERIAKLEDLVRALTAQSPSTASTSSQLLPVQTPNGDLFNLSVPKGHSFVSQKENIRNFTPGKLWMT